MDTTTGIILIECVVSFIVFLFSLYLLCGDDMLMIRKNITMEKVFDTAFLLGIVVLLGARIIFVALHWKPGYLHPLVFFLFPYFPGLSLTGGIIFALLFLLALSRTKKFPTAKFFDFFSFSLLAGLSVGFFLHALFFSIQTRGISSSADSITAVLFFVLFLFFKQVFYPLQRRGEFADGSLGLLFFMSYAVIMFLSVLLQKADRVFFFFHKEDFLLIPLFFICLGFFIYTEKLFFAKR